MTKKRTTRSSVKKTTKKPASKKASAKTVAKKPATKKAKTAPKTTTKAAVSKKAPAKKVAIKKTTKPVATKKAPAVKAPPKASPATQGKPGAKAGATQGKPDDKTAMRKGITIVSKKTMRRKVTPKPLTTIPKMGAALFGKKRKPLIVSGPKAAVAENSLLELDDEARKKLKTPFNKRELAKFKQILLKKLDELAGDVTRMEKEALQGESGELSSLPSHQAEQGSDAYDQMLSLDLAAADREIITEIIDALKRITAKTFGLCELTGKPITLERLEELPWARHSIDAARQMERRTQYQ